MARPGHQFNISWVTHVANANRPNSPVTCTRSPNQEVEVANLGTGSSAHLSRSRDHGVVDDAEMARALPRFQLRANERSARHWAGMPCRYAWSLATGAAGFGRSNAAKSGAVLRVEGEDVELHADEAAGFLTAAVSRVYVRLVRTHACR